MMNAAADMKKLNWVLITALVLSLVVFPGSALTKCSSSIIDTSKLKNFTGISVGSAGELNVSYAPDYQVTITTSSDRVKDYLVVDVSGSIVHIYLKPGFVGFGKNPFTVTVKAPIMRSIELSGAAKGTVTGYSDLSEFHFELSGASSLTGSIDTHRLSVGLSGASMLVLSGKGEDVTVNCSGASKFDGAAFSAANGIFKVSGASTVFCNVSDTITVSASGASTVVNKGKPQKKNVETSGASVYKEE